MKESLVMISLSSRWARKEGRSRMTPRKSSLKILHLQLTPLIYLLSQIVRQEKIIIRWRLQRTLYKRKMKSSPKGLIPAPTKVVQAKYNRLHDLLLCPLSSLKMKGRNSKLGRVLDLSNNPSRLSFSCPQKCNK